MTKLSIEPTETVRRIYALHEARNDKPRPYLGASIIGKACERALWCDFRWCTERTFDGRMMRLFETGHLAEPRMIAELRAIGIEVHERDPRTGQQFGFTEPATGHHLRGHLDGLARRVPEAEKAGHVVECKTHNAKSFAELEKVGVERAKPMHAAQMQLYMHWTIDAWGNDGCDRALYIAENKNTSELYVERLRYDAKQAEALIAKAQRVIFAQTPPPRMSDDPSWYECKLCDHRAVCHAGAVPAVSCRTCAHATPEHDGDARWTCALNGNNDIPEAHQREAHPCHRFIPPLVEAHFDLFDWQAPNTVTWINKATGKQFAQPDWSSAEMHAAQDKRAIGDEEIDVFRKAFDAHVDHPAPDLYWQTFTDGRRMLHDKNRASGVFVPQTVENIELCERQGNREWVHEGEEA